MSSDFAISVSGLNQKFGRKVVLNDLNFRVPMNTISGFLGPNGAGKTTTLRILMGLIPLRKGSINMLGEDLPEGRVKAIEQIGAVVENPAFIETLSAFDNLYWFGSLYKPVTKERILESIEMVGLKDAAYQRFGSFSSGMKQRLGVAFGILHKPRLLILDEPTSGMDPVGRVQMREILQRIHSEERTSIFLSSHLLDEVQRLCDYVVIIDRGKTLQEGFVRDILSGHQEVWEIRIPDESFKKAAEILKQFEQEGLIWSEGPQGFILKMNTRISDKINAALVKEGIGVYALIPQEASLEDTFIRLTSERSKDR
ncbi:MAG: ABC transporter ATP-binding protein [Candidatus Rifleibacteriota bacterium]